MTDKQNLLLFLIDKDPEFWALYTLEKAFEKADPPANIRFHLQPLIAEGLIEVYRAFDNGEPAVYCATRKGRARVETEIDLKALEAYAGSLKDAALILRFFREDEEDEEDNSIWN